MKLSVAALGLNCPSQIRGCAAKHASQNACHLQAIKDNWSLT